MHTGLKRTSESGTTGTAGGARGASTGTVTVTVSPAIIARAGCCAAKVTLMAVNACGVASTMPADTNSPSRSCSSLHAFSAVTKRTVAALAKHRAAASKARCVYCAVSALNLSNSALPACWRACNRELVRGRTCLGASSTQAGRDSDSVQVRLG
jgi:hypothetical protein